MKRFLLFTGWDHEAGGGWNDFVGDFDTLEGAQMKAVEQFRTDWDDWAHVIDTTTMAEVWRTKR